MLLCMAKVVNCVCMGFVSLSFSNQATNSPWLKPFYTVDRRLGAALVGIVTFGLARVQLKEAFLSRIPALC
jgi:hypothetical protein